METPDQLLQRLDVMGEERVRALLGSKYFEPKKIQLVQGWLDKIDDARREDLPREPTAEELVETARIQAKEAAESAAKARERAAEAVVAARKAQRTALIAMTVGATGLLVSTLLLFAMALR